MATFLLLLSLGCVFYAYLGYPLLLAGLVPPRRADLPLSSLPRSLSVIIAARNEAARIRAKLENTMEAVRKLRMQLEVEVIVASDCSDDGTDEIVGEFPEVQLVRSPSRSGKEFAQRLAVERSRGEIIVFTDAKVVLEPDALVNFIPWFSDVSVGAVSSTDHMPNSAGSGEGAYVRYEMWIRRLETRYCSLVGLSGSCFAVRREICSGMRADVPSDFALLLEAVRRGKRGVAADDVVARYESVLTAEEEFPRKIRTVLRGLTAFFSCPFGRGLPRAFRWQLLSHKLMRWLVPFFLALAFISALFGSKNSVVCALILVGMGAFFFIAGIGYRYPELRHRTVYKIPLYFTIANAAIAMAWWSYLTGERAVSWTPSARGTEE